jgi:hypothetical protein
MKPTFRTHFSEEHPNRPGLWLSRRKNYIAVLQVDDGDIERDKRQNGAWLDGEWGAHIELVDRDVVPLDRRKVQEHLDAALSDAHAAKESGQVEALQGIREALIGNRLELPDAAPEEPMPEEPKPSA